MKKILSLTALCAALSSCAPVLYQYADISLLDNNGDIVRYWDNAVIARNVGSTAETSPIKLGGGFSFTTKEGEAVYTSGGILIVENIGNKNTAGSYVKAPENGGKLYSILDDIESVNNELKDIKVQMKKTSDPAELKKLQEREADLKEELKQLKEEYSRNK